MKLAANKFAQEFFTRRLKKTLKFLGVGIGGSVTKSGEHGILQKLKELNLVQLCLFDVGANKGDSILGLERKSAKWTYSMPGKPVQLHP
jgi:hypothetical protein